MLIELLCCFCRKLPSGPKLTAKQKTVKWFRLVALMTIKKYGCQILGHLFFAFLFAEAINAMDSIWGEFSEFNSCNSAYIANITSLVADKYSEAILALSAAVLEVSECIMGTMDVKIFGAKFSLGSLTADLFGDIFGWFTVGEVAVPDSDLSLDSNTDEVLAEVDKDLNLFRLASRILKLVGYISAILGLIWILVKATYYTVTNQRYKPGAISLAMRLVEGLRIVISYAVLSAAVFLQAYVTQKFCKVNINQTDMTTPECWVTKADCQFYCKNDTITFQSPCVKCDIQLNWWWVDYFCIPNILGVSYIAFLLLVILIEFVESCYQNRELTEAAKLEEEKKVRRNERKKKKRAHEKRLLEKSNHNHTSAHAEDVYVPPDVGAIVDIESGNGQYQPLQDPSGAEAKEKEVRERHHRSGRHRSSGKSKHSSREHRRHRESSRMAEEQNEIV